MAHVLFPRSWESLTSTTRRIDVDAADVGGLVAELMARFPNLDRWLDNGVGGVPEYTNIFVDGQDVRIRQGAATPLSDDDEVHFIVEMSGG